MTRNPYKLEALKRAVIKLEGKRNAYSLSPSGGDCVRYLTFELEALDTAVSGGLDLDALHEIRCAHSRDIGAGIAFLCAFLSKQNTNKHGKIVWISDPAARLDSGNLCPDGLAQIGLDPTRFIFVRPRDLKSSIWAAGEAARQGSLAAVIFHVKGNPKTLDLAVSRKLMLRAQIGRTPLFILRQAGGEEASSATTRWNVEPARSLKDNIYHRGIGRMRHRLTLERNRNGQTGNWPICWNPSKGLFEHAAENTSSTHHSHPFFSSGNRPDSSKKMGQIVDFERAS